MEDTTIAIIEAFVVLMVGCWLIIDMEEFSEFVGNAFRKIANLFRHHPKSVKE